MPKSTAVHLESEPPETEQNIGRGLGWGIESDHGAFFQWGKMTGVRAFVMGSPAEQSGIVLFANCNTGLRLMEEVTKEALSEVHPAIRWLEECVTE